MNTTIKALECNPIIPVIRNSNIENISNILNSLYEGGIKAVEITAETKGFLEILKKVVSEYGDKMYIGVGTVLDPETAAISIMHGADFIVSPTFNLETITMVKRYGKLMISGALTPTEVLEAYTLGSDIIKIFPAGNLGASYIKNIKGPLKHIPLMATGGIKKDNYLDFLDAGCIAVGLGSDLVNAKYLNKEKEFQVLKKEVINLFKLRGEDNNE